MVWKRLARTGTAIFGDLMFINATAKEDVLEGFKKDGRPELADETTEEFVWDLGKSIATLRRIGFTVSSKQFSTLSFGVVAEKHR